MFLSGGRLQISTSASATVLETIARCLFAIARVFSRFTEIVFPTAGPNKGRGA